MSFQPIPVALAANVLWGERKQLGIGVAANSCTNADLDSTTDGDAERSDIDETNVPVSDPENGAQNGTGNDDAAVERRRTLDGRRLGLVALEPGRDIGPYRLQVSVGLLKEMLLLFWSCRM